MELQRMSREDEINISVSLILAGHFFVRERGAFRLPFLLC